MFFLTGTFIEQQRRLAGLSRSQFAALIGYTNMNKGAKRITELEQWGDARGDLLARIVGALMLDAEQVRELLAEDERRAREAWERFVSEPVAPVLRFRPLPAVWCGERLPHGLTRDEAVAHVRSRAVTAGWVYVLVWNRREEVWCYEDGRVGTVAIRFGEVAGPATTVRT